MGDLKTRPRQQTDLRTLFVPVIFGNGKDDDTRGLLAALLNEPVYLEDRVYQPGEDMTICGMHLVFQRLRIEAQPIECRHVTFVGCFFDAYD
jgi:hypothetical protein